MITQSDNISDLLFILANYILLKNSMIYRSCLLASVPADYNNQTYKNDGIIKIEKNQQ